MKYNITHHNNPTSSPKPDDLHAQLFPPFGCPMMSCPGFEPAELEHADRGRGRWSNGYGTSNLGLCQVHWALSVALQVNLDASGDLDR